MKRTAQKKVNKLESLDVLIKEEYEGDAGFATLLDRARLRVAMARAIKHAREEAGLTQAELAKALNITQPMVGRLESMKDKRLPGIELLFRIASVTRKRLVLDQKGIRMEDAA